MKKFATCLLAATTTFVLGSGTNLTALRFASPAPVIAVSEGPMHIQFTCSDEVIDGLKAESVVALKNIGDKAIAGYTLAFEGEGVRACNPHLRLVTSFSPGQARAVGLPFKHARIRKVWIDVVLFEDGSRWGPDDFRYESYGHEVR